MSKHCHTYLGLVRSIWSVRKTKNPIKWWLRHIGQVKYDCIDGKVDVTILNCLWPEKGCEQMTVDELSTIMNCHWPETGCEEQMTIDELHTTMNCHWPETGCEQRQLLNYLLSWTFTDLKTGCKQKTVDNYLLSWTVTDLKRDANKLQLDELSTIRTCSWLFHELSLTWKQDANKWQLMNYQLSWTVTDLKRDVNKWQLMNYLLSWTVTDLIRDANIWQVMNYLLSWTVTDLKRPANIWQLMNYQLSWTVTDLKPDTNLSLPDQPSLWSADLPPQELDYRWSPPFPKQVNKAFLSIKAGQIRRLFDKFDNEFINQKLTV